MATNDNPVGRLYQIISDMISDDPDGAQPFQKVMESTLDLPSGDPAEALITIGKLFQLTQDGQELIESLEGLDRQQYRKPLLVVEQALAKINLEANWQTFRSRIDETTLTSLQFVSDVLSIRAGEKVLDEVSLTELLADVNTLLERFLEAQLPEDLKVDLVDHLEDMRSAIIDYRLFGPESLKKTFDNNLGLILRRRDEMQEVENSEGKGILSDFASLIAKLGVIISAGTKFKELVEPIIHKVLPGGDN